MLCVGVGTVLGLGYQSFGLSWLLGVWDNLFVPFCGRSAMG